MQMTQRGRLDDKERVLLRASMKEAEEANAVLERHRQRVARWVAMSSFREVSDLTGISTTTLQRWKKEADQ